MNPDTLITRIDALLPQTQCGQCGYAGCKPYAQALASQQADINQCPPGGEDGIRALAGLLGRPYLPLNPVHGVFKPKAVALIDEAACIGCTLCIQACPVDAILGANRLMHTVISSECTGCELCLPPCPVDCIRLEVIQDAARLSSQALQKAADQARRRFESRQRRLASRLQHNQAKKAEVSQAYANKAAANKPAQASQSAMPASSNASDAELATTHSAGSSLSSKGDALKKAALAAAMAKARDRAVEQKPQDLLNNQTPTSNQAPPDLP